MRYIPFTKKRLVLRLPWTEDDLGGYSCILGGRPLRCVWCCSVPSATIYGFNAYTAETTLQLLIHTRLGESTPRAAILITTPYVARISLSNATEEKGPR